MNILFYYPDKERAVSLSSLMIAFRKQGHQVFLLTHSMEGNLHREVKKHDVGTFSYPIKKNISFLFYLKHILYLASFTRKHNIDIVYSHIQRSNFISAFAQYLSPSRFILCRHHSDCVYVDYNFTERLFDIIINRLGREFIVPSQMVLTQVKIKEKVRTKKIHLIRYGYNFDEYSKPDPDEVRKIRNTYNCNLLLIKVARLIPEKRHIILFRTVKNLVEKGYDIKLLVPSDGREREVLHKFIVDNHLEDHIYLLGYQDHVMNLVAASDLVVHVSCSEASNNFIKEVSLLEKPVIVCSGVGDFDEYITDGLNGIKISKDASPAELENILEKVYLDKIDIHTLGKKLRQDVVQLFGIDNIIKSYSVFHEN
ncbi:MAG: glycosyltransferase [Bacteroidetes bacterium]|nr:glycosyltransferase [Bacteroidota bacterium]